MSALAIDTERARAAARSRHAESGNLTEMARLLLREARDADHRGTRGAGLPQGLRGGRPVPAEQAAELLPAA